MTARVDDIARLRRVFRTVFEDSEFQLQPALKMGDIEAWDSFNHINLMLGIETEFGIEFDHHEMGQLLYVQAIVDALQRHLDDGRS